MIAHYGYRDASGEYFIAVDTARCDGCGNCARDCLGGALEMTVQLIGLEEKRVAGVREQVRRRLKDACAACAGTRPPCEEACAPGALSVTYRSGP